MVVNADMCRPFNLVNPGTLNAGPHTFFDSLAMYARVTPDFCWYCPTTLQLPGPPHEIDRNSESPTLSFASPGISCTAPHFPFVSLATKLGVPGPFMRLGKFPPALQFPTEAHESESTPAPL